MYSSYFGFITPPFDNKLDQRFLFLGPDHEEVLAALHYFIREKKGMAMVCGDVGTGKTMLLHGFLAKLPAKQTIWVKTDEPFSFNSRTALHAAFRPLDIPRVDPGGPQVRTTFS